MENVMDWACIVHGTEEKLIQSFDRNSYKKRGSVEDLSID
jgi:hypothetical protein